MPSIYFRINKDLYEICYVVLRELTQAGGTLKNVERSRKCLSMHFKNRRASETRQIFEIIRVSIDEEMSLYYILDRSIRIH